MRKTDLRETLINWSLFLVLALIWGSSFMLMKVGMNTLSPYQVASIRILSAGLVLLPFALKALRAIPREKLKLVVLSGILGSFFPAYLFCIAETKIDSSLAGILNALTPLFTILIGIGFFHLKAAPIKILGVSIGFIGLCLLMLQNKEIGFQYLSYTFLVVLATIFYGINVNLIGKHMQGIGSLHIASVAFVSLVIPNLLILMGTGFFSMPLGSTGILYSSLASAVLGIFGTAIASILFYMLVKRAGSLFASMVTYGIPFVAVVWGIYYGENIGLWQLLCMGIILLGVWLANKKIPVKEMN